MQIIIYCILDRLKYKKKKWFYTFYGLLEQMCVKPVYRIVRSAHTLKMTNVRPLARGKISPLAFAIHAECHSFCTLHTVRSVACCIANAHCATVGARAHNICSSAILPHSRIHIVCADAFSLHTALHLPLLSSQSTVYALLIHALVLLTHAD